MCTITVKSPVYKLYLGNLVVNKKLELFFHHGEIPEPQTFINGGKTVAAGKRTAAAGFIIYDLMLKVFHMVIYKRDLAKVHHRPPWIVCDRFSAPPGDAVNL